MSTSSPTKQLSPKRKAKDGRRRAPNLTEKLAATLLMLKNGNGDWLIPEPIRSSGDAALVISYPEWDHARYHALGGDTRPQNITPLAPEVHKEKTKTDVGRIAKAKRLEKAQEAFRAKVLSKASSDTTEEEKPSRGKFKASMPFGRGSKFKKRMDGKVVPR